MEVEARIVQTTRDFARAIGIQWGLNGRVTPELGNTTSLAFPNRGTLGGRIGAAGPPDRSARDRARADRHRGRTCGVPGATSAIGLALGAVNGAFNLDVALSALERTGKGRVLSTPRLTTQNNIEAEVAQGMQIPIQTVANNTVTVTFKDAVLMLQGDAADHRRQHRDHADHASRTRPPDFSRQVNGIPPIDTQRAQHAGPGRRRRDHGHRRHLRQPGADLERPDAGAAPHPAARLAVQRDARRGREPRAVDLHHAAHPEGLRTWIPEHART